MPPTDDAIFGVGFPGAKSVRGHQFDLLLFGAFKPCSLLSLSLSLAILLTGVVKRDDDMLLWFSLAKGVVSPLKRKCNAQAV